MSDQTLVTYEYLEAKDKEIERLTARLIAESGEVEDLVNRLQESEDDNGRLMKRIAKLEAVIVERDSIIARFTKAMTQQAEYIEELRKGQSATASLERWKDEQPM